MRLAVLPALVLIAALSACGDQTDDGPERKTAAGEVLGGSISDAMLPLATVQSQSPPLRESAAKDDDNADAGANESAGATEEAEPAAAAAPSAEPSATASASATPQVEN